jgi:hypothetical protein
MSQDLRRPTIAGLDFFFLASLGESPPALAWTPGKDGSMFERSISCSMHPVLGAPRCVGGCRIRDLPACRGWNPSLAWRRGVVAPDPCERSCKQKTCTPSQTLASCKVQAWGRPGKACFVFVQRYPLRAIQLVVPTRSIPCLSAVARLPCCLCRSLILFPEIS